MDSVVQFLTGKCREISTHFDQLSSRRYWFADSAIRDPRFRISSVRWIHSAIRDPQSAFPLSTGSIPQSAIRNPHFFCAIQPLHCGGISL
jgi:hypothetical protein